MEPRTSCPRARLRAIQTLSAKQIPTGALLAPIIPGLNDIELPKLVEAAKEFGAATARYHLVRLQEPVAPVFLDWLRRSLPSQAKKIESRIRQTHAGALNGAQFGSRMKGKGELAGQIKRTFEVFAKKHALNGDLPPLDTSQFRMPGDVAQRRLF